MKYESLKLCNQLFFPLYAASKEIIKIYKPLLDKIDLTYTQYITMLVLWEFEEITAKELGNKLYLDSGTLTPLLKKLETKGYITRKRSSRDERNLNVTLTKKGSALKENAVDIPTSVAKSCSQLSQEEAKQLYDILYKLLS